MLNAEKEICCKIKSSPCNLELWLAIYFKTIHAVVEGGRIKICFVKSLQGQNHWEPSCKESMLPATCFATSLQDKLQEKLHRVTLTAELNFTFATIAEIFEAISSLIKKFQRAF